jgi:flagellar hook-associated protein 3 FlgL
LAAALKGNDTAGIQRSLGELNQSLTQVSIARGEAGALAARLETTASGLDDTKGVVTTILSQNEDVDLAKAVSDLSFQQVAVEAASQTIGRLFNSSLLNFLR